jgi:hypothetical protein
MATTRCEGSENCRSLNLTGTLTPFGITIFRQVTTYGRNLPLSHLRQDTIVGKQDWTVDCPVRGNGLEARRCQ